MKLRNDVEGHLTERHSEKTTLLKHAYFQQKQLRLYDIEMYLLLSSVNQRRQELSISGILGLSQNWGTYEFQKGYT